MTNISLQSNNSRNYGSIKKLAILLLLVFSFAISYGQKKEKKLVVKSFAKYKTAILNDKGEEAVNYVDSRTIAYYAKVLKIAINGDSLGVDSLGILDKLMVLSVRHRATKEDILSFDGKSLLIYAIQKGMVGKSSVVNNSIGEVKIDGNFATGQLLVHKSITPLFFNFYKEEGSWKVDLTSIFAVASVGFQKMVDDNEKEENDFLLMVLEMVSQKTPRADIWLPIKK